MYGQDKKVRGEGSHQLGSLMTEQEEHKKIFKREKNSHRLGSALNGLSPGRSEFRLQS